MNTAVTQREGVPAWPRQKVVRFRFRASLKKSAKRAEYAAIEQHLDALRGFRHQMRHMCSQDNYAIAAYMLPVDVVTEALRSFPGVDADTIDTRLP